MNTYSNCAQVLSFLSDSWVDQNFPQILSNNRQLIEHSLDLSYCYIKCKYELIYEKFVENDLKNKKRFFIGKLQTINKNNCIRLSNYKVFYMF
jgi:hypothetical protein